MFKVGDIIEHTNSFGESCILKVLATEGFYICSVIECHESIWCFGRHVVNFPFGCAFSYNCKIYKNSNHPLTSIFK